MKKPPPPGLTEAQVLADCLKVLKLYGIDHERQNTGGVFNDSGQYVRFGRPGNPDITGILPAWFGVAAGRRIDVEVKRSCWRPPRVGTKAREHWDRQRTRLMATNEAGGYGFVITDAAAMPMILEGIRSGCRIVFDGDYPFLTDEGET